MGTYLIAPFYVTRKARWSLNALLSNKNVAIRYVPSCHNMSHFDFWEDIYE